MRRSVRRISMEACASQLPSANPFVERQTHCCTPSGVFRDVFGTGLDQAHKSSSTAPHGEYNRWARRRESQWPQGSSGGIQEYAPDSGSRRGKKTPTVKGIITLKNIRNPLAQVCAFPNLKLWIHRGKRNLEERLEQFSRRGSPNWPAFAIQLRE